MPTRLIGVTVGSGQVNVVLLSQETNGSFTLDEETTLKLQDGDRASAYSVMHGQFLDYVLQHASACVCVKRSAVSRRGTTLAHLEAAELRGVILAAASQANAEVRTVSKAATSRTFGDRKVDQYLRDDGYWNGIGLGGLKKGMREAAFAAVCEFSN